MSRVSWPMVVSLLTALFTAVIGVLSYLRGRRQNIYRSFSVLNFSFSLWCFAALRAWPDFTDPFWMKLMYSPVAWIPGAALSFVWGYTGLPESSRRRRTLPLYLAGAAMLGLLWSGAISLARYRWAFFAGGVPVFTLGLGLLYRHWRRADSGAERNRHGYMLAASSILVVGALSDVLWLATGYYPSPSRGTFSIALYSIIVLLAVERHHLLDLGEAAGAGLVMAGASLALSGVLTGIAWLTRKAGGPLFLNFFLLNLVLLAALPPLWERMSRFFGSWFSARQMRRDQALDHMERSLERCSSLEAIASAVRATVRSVWGAEAELLWVGRSLRSLEPGPALPEALKTALLSAPKATTSDSLRLSDGREELRNMLVQRGAEAAAPVFREGELVGAVLLGAPVEGFYDFAAVRWLSRLAGVVGRAVQGAETAAALLQADRLAQLGTLAAGVAHEVRNPLSAMLGAVDLLGKPLDEARRQEYLAVLSEEVRRLDGIVTDLLEYASPRAGRSRCSWAETWEKVDRLLKADWPAGVALQARGEPLELAVSSAHLQQILINLLRNAARAASSGAGGGRAGEVRVNLRRQGRTALLEVSDNGAGIPAELLPRLFTPFATGSQAGTGLGLATVKRLAELYGGAAWAENLSPGARFAVELPVVD